MMKRSKESLKRCLVEVLSSESQRDYSEVKKFWNCFLILDDKESYGLVLIDGGFIDDATNQLEAASNPSDDLMFVMENALCCTKFRLLCLRNLSLINALCASFNTCLENCNVYFLKHVLIVMRNLFYEIPSDDETDWFAYRTAHAVAEKYEISKGLVQIIKENDDLRFRFFALEIASFDFVDLDNESVFAAVKSMCEFIIDYMMKAIKNPNFAMALPGTEYNTTALNVCSMLCKIMYSDEVKKLCFSEELVESLLKFLEHRMAAKNCAEVLTILDYLCFIEKQEIGSTVVYGNKSLYELVQYLSEKTETVPERFKWITVIAKEPQVISAAKSLNRGLLAVKEFQEGETIAACTSVELGASNAGGLKSAGGSYIMLSYNWESKELVKVLVQKLRHNSYDVWLDDDKMAGYGDINDAMSDAVERCELMVAVVSEKYKTSINCRRELEYADNRNKPYVFVKKDQAFDPNGWLGLMMGKRLYFTLDERNIDQSCESVIMGIKSKLSGQDLAIDSAPNDDPEPAKLQPVVKSTRKKAVVMSHDKYKEWVKKNPSISFLRNRANKKKFNEIVIAGLVDQLHERTSKDFSDYLQSNFKLSASEALTLLKVLENYNA